MVEEPVIEATAVEAAVGDEAMVEVSDCAGPTHRREACSRHPWNALVL